MLETEIGVAENERAKQCEGQLSEAAAIDGADMSVDEVKSRAAADAASKLMWRPSLAHGHQLSIVDLQATSSQSVSALRPSALLQSM